jgi:hypothetical protein
MTPHAPVNGQKMGLSVMLRRVTLVDGRTVDLGRNEYHSDPYVKGAECAFWAWRDFMRGRAMEVKDNPPSYLPDAFHPSLRAGFFDNLGNQGLIEASR